MIWDEVVCRMLDELRAGDARAESYWAQQLAFGPVVVHALRLHLRAKHLPDADVAHLSRAIHLAQAGLGPLPERPGTDPASLALLARRQARAISWGRRRCLARLLQRLGADQSPASPASAERMLRPYPLIGFRPDERLAA